MTGRSTQLIVILSGVLIAAVVASGVLLWLTSDRSSTTTVAEPVATRVPVTTTSPAATGNRNGTSFNTRVLETGAYTSLDKKLITDGAVPVQPPPVVGKANPFL